MAKRKNKTIVYVWGIITLILVGTASWSLYSLVNQGASDLLLRLGIESFYLQGIIVVVFVLILLILAGFGFKKTFEKIIGK